MLLEKALAIGQATGERAQKAALHLPAQLKIGLHHHHRVALAINALAATQADVKKGIEFAGGRENRHGCSSDKKDDVPGPVTAQTSHYIGRNR